MFLKTSEPPRKEKILTDSFLSVETTEKLLTALDSWNIYDTKKVHEFAQAIQKLKNVLKPQICFGAKPIVPVKTS